VGESPSPASPPSLDQQKGAKAAVGSREMVQLLLHNYYIKDCKIFALIRDLTCDAGWSGWQLARL